MRILFITPSYYPHIGGVEYVVKSVAERLNKMGHDVIVVAGEPRGNAPFEEVINGVKVVRWPVWNPGGAYHFPKKVSELTKLLTKLSKSINVVHVHSVHSVFSMSSLRVLKKENCKVVLTPYYHGTGHTALRRILWLYWRRHVERLLENCIVHTVSSLEAALMKRNLGVEAKPIENGVEEWVKEVEWNPRGYAMYSGRIERYKNVHVLAKVIKIVNDKCGTGLELKIFGDGTWRDDLIKFLRKLKVEFEINTFKPFEQYIHALSHASLFVLLSEKESYPQSVNEANAIGVPAVVAEPWGRNFEGRSRTLIVDLSWGAKKVAEKVCEFLARAPLERRSDVPTWSEVAKRYLNELYKG